MGFLLPPGRPPSEVLRPVHKRFECPGAVVVSVIGDFNDWQAGRTPLAPRGPGGVWEAFVPELHTGDLHKYGIRSRYHGYYTEKADPYGVYAEVRPGTASTVCVPGTTQGRSA